MRERLHALGGLAQEQALGAARTRLAKADDRADHHADQHVQQRHAEGMSHALQLRRVGTQPVDDCRAHRVRIFRHVLAQPVGHRAARAGEDIRETREERSRARAFASQHRRGAEAGAEQRADDQRRDETDAHQPRPRVAALAEGDAWREQMHELVHQQAAEERADQAELQAESEPHHHGDQGRRAGARLGEERRAVIV